MSTKAKTVIDVHDSKYTDIPLSIAAAKARHQPGLDSEFCRMGDLERLFGIKRPSGYTLEKLGLIETVSLRQRGHVRGIKLVSIQSVRSYLHGLLEAQSKHRGVTP